MLLRHKKMTDTAKLLRPIHTRGEAGGFVHVLHGYKLKIENNALGYSPIMVSLYVVYFVEEQNV